MNPNPSEKPKILVVDDQKHMVKLITYNLAKTGCDILAAHLGQEALDICASNLVSLMVIDYSMPDLDGFETVRRLKTDPRYATLPVIMLTARGASDMKELAEAAGVTVFLTKPFSPNDLLRQVRQLLNLQP